MEGQYHGDSRQPLFGYATKTFEIQLPNLIGLGAPRLPRLVQFYLMMCYFWTRVCEWISLLCYENKPLK